MGAPAAPGVFAADVPFAVLTAWNPRSNERTVEANAASQARLAAELADLRLEALEAENSDASGHHHELGFFVPGIADADCDRLARAFGQNAVLTGRIGAPVRLRVYRDWAADARAAGIDLRFVDFVG